MITEAIGSGPIHAGTERPQFFAKAALVMAAIVVLSFPVTYYSPVATESGRFDPLHPICTVSLTSRDSASTSGRRSWSLAGRLRGIAKSASGALH
jgi:hypothetical protein